MVLPRVAGLDDDSGITYWRRIQLGYLDHNRINCLRNRDAPVSHLVRSGSDVDEVSGMQHIFSQTDERIR